MKNQGNNITPQRLEMMVRTHQTMLFRYLRYLGAQNAEDLTQESFVQAFKTKNAPPEGESKREIAWLRGIARNIFLMQCRQQKTHQMLFNSEVIETAESVWSGLERSGDQGFEYVEALHGCMEQLKPKDREALDMRYRLKRSREQMARQLEMKPDGVKTMMRRLRVILGKCVERKVGLEEVG